MKFKRGQIVRVRVPSIDELGDMQHLQNRLGVVGQVPNGTTRLLYSVEFGDNYGHFQEHSLRAVRVMDELEPVENGEWA